MFSVIFKTAVKSILGVAILALVVFAVLSLGFPSTMAGLCEKTGNYSMATGYASLNYTYTGDVNDLNRCFTDSIFAKDDTDIVKFGEKLIQDEKFEEVCNSMVSGADGVELNYKQFVYGSVAAAKYRNGKTEDAFNTAKDAMAGVQGFPVNNALAVLSLQVIESGDKDTADMLIAEIENNHEDAENEYYTALINELTKVGGEE